jgi:hypothetical protein
MEHHKLLAFTPVYYVVLQLAIVKDKCEILRLGYSLYTQLISFVGSFSNCYFEGRPCML